VFSHQHREADKRSKDLQNAKQKAAAATIVQAARVQKEDEIIKIKIKSGKRRKTHSNKSQEKKRIPDTGRKEIAGIEP
jgi:competence protein ComGF